MSTSRRIFLTLRYLAINIVFGASIYFGFFGEIDGAKNLALFIGWVTGLLGVLFLLGLYVDDRDDNGRKGELREHFARMEQSVIPFPIDLAFDLIVTGVFIWFGHYVLAIFYIFAIVAGKQIRDVPKDVMLKKLKGQS